jgi:hypothetical protein
MTDSNGHDAWWYAAGLPSYLGRHVLHALLQRGLSTDLQRERIKLRSDLVARGAVWQ